MEPITLTTDRLILRQWRPQDIPAYAAMSGDPRVMEHYPAIQSRAESEASLLRFQARIAERGWGIWALEDRASGETVGFTGLQHPPFEEHFTPCIEIGWRVAFERWGEGLAPEAARAALAFGFERLGVDEIVAMTSLPNRRSMRVMEKLGMTRDPADDFDVPMIPEGHRLRRHVLYRLKR